MQGHRSHSQEAKEGKWGASQDREDACSPSMVSGDTETPLPDSRRDCWDIRLAEGLGVPGVPGPAVIPETLGRTMHPNQNAESKSRTPGP